MPIVCMTTTVGAAFDTDFTVPSPGPQHGGSVTGPLVIGHRGASGHRPEHTALAYQLAWRSGADSVEPDVVCTRDGILVCRHDLDLAPTTDVADRPEFAHKRRTMEVDGELVDGWFVQDFYLEELKRAAGSRAVAAEASRQRDVRRPAARCSPSRTCSTCASRSRPAPVASSACTSSSSTPRCSPACGCRCTSRSSRSCASGGSTPRSARSRVMSFESEILKRLRRDLDVEIVQLLDRHETVRSRRLHRRSATTHRRSG